MYCVKEESKEIKKIKRDNSKVIITMFTIPILIVLILIGSQSYLNTKEIEKLENKCEQSGGTSKLDASVLNIGYSFECE